MCGGAFGRFETPPPHGGARIGRILRLDWLRYGANRLLYPVQGMASVPIGPHSLRAIVDTRTIPDRSLRCIGLRRRPLADPWTNHRNL